MKTQISLTKTALKRIKKDDLIQYILNLHKGETEICFEFESKEEVVDVDINVKFMDAFHKYVNTNESVEEISIDTYKIQILANPLNSTNETSRYKEKKKRNNPGIRINPCYINSQIFRDNNILCCNSHCQP